ncbi:MAG: aldehyde dehydrogenase family protein, partial [Burkholderiales bacterium]|nr:aldehyde dehydrogenase family protein [Burkholderiales bacterium]
MPYLTLNPATGRMVKTFESWDAKKLNEALTAAQRAQIEWRETDFSMRAKLMHRTAALLRERATEYAAIMTTEMGKVIAEARAEIEKCAVGCDFYADHAERFLADELIETDAGKSYVCYQPLGTVLAIMPWNFPFWQVFRFAAPALMAGNAGVLKHAPNVPQCALAIEAIFRDAGFPEHLFMSALIEVDAVPDAIAGPYVHAVTLTGSEGAGREVAAHAGRHLKKCVLELGGSDPFIVLRDADLEFTAEQAIKSRYMNCGQSCIAAKRFIL